MRRISSVNCKSRVIELGLIAFILAAIAPALAQNSRPDYEANVTKMTDVLKTKPNDDSAHYYRAVALQNLGQYQQAKLDYQWVSTHSKNPTLLRYSAAALQSLSGAGTAGYGTTRSGSASPAGQSMMPTPTGASRPAGQSMMTGTGRPAGQSMMQH